MTISIYQIQYSTNVTGTFDSSFIKYDCRDYPEPDKREIAHMLRFYDEGAWKEQKPEYFGLVSPKFTDKAKISGQAFIDWVQSNPGYDVYFINPFPQLNYWHFNVWTQGEFWHPGLVELANALFAAAGYSIQIDKLPRNTSASLLYSNYWVGNEKFWNIYMAFVRKLVASVDNLSSDNKKKLFELAPHYTPATYFPFIFERLFSTFLVLHKNISCLPYPHDREKIVSLCDNKMERFIINEWGEMIDTWDAYGRNSAEYRKLFFNLQSMLKIYQSEIPLQGKANQEIKMKLFDKLKERLKFIH